MSCTILIDPMNVFLIKFTSLDCKDMMVVDTGAVRCVVVDYFQHILDMATLNGLYDDGVKYIKVLLS